MLKSEMTTETLVVLQHLSCGSITIDDEGLVWRHSIRKGSRVVLLAEPRRIDHPNRIGYCTVKLTAPSGERISTSAHRIQWLKEHGEIPEGFEINHKDLNKSNNRIGNLELMTRGDNVRHAHANGCATSYQVGESNGHARLTWDDVRFIREQVQSRKATQAAMAKRFGVHQVTICLIMSGKNWNPANDPMNLEPTQ